MKTSADLKVEWGGREWNELEILSGAWAAYK